MDESSAVPPKPREYFVLVEGQMHGPFTIELLKAELESGELTAEDLVQVGGLPIWRPLSQVLNTPEIRRPLSPPPPPLEMPPPIESESRTENAALEPIVAVEEADEAFEVERQYSGPADWNSICRLAKDRFRDDFDNGSVRIGVVCLVVGIITCIAARWPFLFWLPWFGLAFYAGFCAVRRGRTMQGVALLVGACAIPILFSMVLPVTRRPVSAPLDELVEIDRSGPVASPMISPNREPTPSRSEAPDNPAGQPSVPTVFESVVTPEPKAATPPPAPPNQPVPSVPASTPVPKPPPQASAIVTPPPVASSAPASEIPVARTLSPLPSFDLGTSSSNNPIVGGDLVQVHRDCLVVVKEGSSSGSGFVCRDGQKTWLVTNAHVAAGMRNPQFSRLDGSQIRVTAPEAGGARDVIRFSVTDHAHPLEILQNLDAVARIGDDVVVLGNSGGGGVVTSLSGKLVGIGPDRIEVTAEFIPGNSGSPIIHVPTGKVIGVATYLTKRYEEFSGRQAGSNDKDMTIRRFGYRLDRMDRWDPVNWAKFHAEAEQMRKISALTADVFDFIEALQRRAEPQFETETLRRPATEWLSGIRKAQVSAADRSRTTQNFLSNLRFMVRSDVANAENLIGYGFFREQLRKEREVRDRLFKAFDDEVKLMTSPTMR